MRIRKGLGRLDGLVVALLSILPYQALACAPPPRPAITIATEQGQVQFDTSRTIAELGRMEVASAASYPSHYHTTVGGVMRGEIVLDHRIVFNRIEGSAGACSSVVEIRISLSMNPTIFIANEYTAAGQECWFREIFGHEEKHVAVDSSIIREYKDRITDGLNMMLLEPADYASGMRPVAEIEKSEAALKQGIDAGLRVLFDDMMAERARRQQAVDTADEYARIARACQVSS